MDKETRTNFNKLTPLEQGDILNARRKVKDAKMVDICDLYGIKYARGSTNARLARLAWPALRDAIENGEIANDAAAVIIRRVKEHVVLSQPGLLAEALKVRRSRGGARSPAVQRPDVEEACGRLLRRVNQPRRAAPTPPTETPAPATRDLPAARRHLISAMQNLPSNHSSYGLIKMALSQTHALI